jgi:hypothetical protein
MKKLAVALVVLAGCTRNVRDIDGCWTEQCRAMMRQARAAKGPPPLSCGVPLWEGPLAFLITCRNAVPTRGAEDTVPPLALTSASIATLLTDSDYFYIAETRLDAAAKLFQLRGMALHSPATAPEGKLAIFTGTYVQAAEAAAVRLQARETRCRVVFGNPTAPAEEQQVCGQFLAWREQVHAREAQTRMQEQIRNDQMAAQARMEEEARRQRVAQALRSWSAGQAEQQRRNDEERRHQELLQRMNRPTTTKCRSDGFGGVRCTTQ